MKKKTGRKAGEKITGFPLDSISALNAGDARLVNEMARLSRCVEHAAGSTARALEDLLGVQVTLRVIPPSGTFRVQGPGPETWQPCVLARIMLVEDDVQLLLMVPAKLLEKILVKIFPVQRSDVVPDRSVLEALSSLLILEAMAALPGNIRPARLVSVTLVDDPASIPLEPAHCYMDIKISLESRSHILSLLMSERDLLHAGPGLKETLSVVPPPDGVLACRIPVRLMCGAARLAAGQARDLSPGDVLIPDVMAEGTVEAGPLEVFLAIRSDAGYYKIGACRVEGRDIRVYETYLTRAEKLMADHDEHGPDDKTEVTSKDGRLPGGVETIPVEVAVEAGRVEMPVGEIASLVPGSIIKMNRPLSASVTLTSSGRILAYGMLVSVEGEMGVQILKVNP